ncbi:MAG: hypothetical protein WC483_00660 [Candidatus Paceibacterota bacterium]
MRWLDSHLFAEAGGVVVEGEEEAAGGVVEGEEEAASPSPLSAREELRK